MKNTFSESGQISFWGATVLQTKKEYPRNGQSEH